MRPTRLLGKVEEDLISMAEDNVWENIQLESLFICCLLSPTS